MIGFLSLGSNLGDRKGNLERALNLLEDSPTLHPSLKIIKVSGFYETEPWGGVEQEPFYNLAVKIESTLEPLSLLRYCQRIEHLLGRERKLHWGPRVIDIDILTYHNYRINSQELTLPHPYMERREFVLAPLREIEPELVLPSGRPIQEVKGEGKVKKISFA
ncbi:MAG TPA: 2-amino-4-hydroxy-6-hydroxymethyldihydropteridine diphosphokinase [Peptococcaceae bacterium]|nr:2-amino-4-hydroxy-6-hydroxymethyldihydropteridine diphosphokinase [Peptococcaceae bacterium]